MSRLTARASVARQIVTSATFDDPNLIGSAGLVPVRRLAEAAGMTALAQQHLTVPTDKGANAGMKVASLVTGMAAGADSIDDMALLRHGAMPKVLPRPYAPSTLGSFLRSFTFGHVRQLDAVASRLLTRLAESTPVTAGIDGRVLVDVDDTIIEVHGHTKQGSGAICAVVILGGGLVARLPLELRVGPLRDRHPPGIRTCGHHCRGRVVAGGRGLHGTGDRGRGAEPGHGGRHVQGLVWRRR